MNKFAKRAAAAVTAASLLLNTALPVFAGTTIEISGNGSDTNNTANVEIEQNKTVVQQNTAIINNYVDADADTGNNDANRNTGGDVDIDTGNANTTVAVSNTVNSNSAEVGCCVGDVDVLIAGNGDNSDNDVTVNVNDAEDKTGTFVYQTNLAKIYNHVKADAETGENDANQNTGGDVSIETGNASTSVSVSNQANANSATVSGNDSGVMLSARIVGNGADSDNDINLEYERLLLLRQDNRALIRNRVKAEAETGENHANRNTGARVSIDTGRATTEVAVDNMFNFNWADVDCGCLLDVLAKIAGNGDKSVNDIIVDVDDTLEVYQDNSCGKFFHYNSIHRLLKRPCETKVHADSDTGENDAERNTGDPGVDPSISTGNASTDVLIENAGNSNVFGEGAPDDFGFEWPSLPGFSFNLNLSFSLSDLLAVLLG